MFPGWSLKSDLQGEGFRCRDRVRGRVRRLGRPVGRLGLRDRDLRIDRADEESV